MDEYNWLDPNFEDGFNPEDHGIEMDEIALMHAMEDMKDSQRDWARQQAEKFYNDFADLDIPTAVKSIMVLIKKGEVTHKDINMMLDNMIQIFQESEEYERCHICLQIKKGIDARI